MPQHISHEFEQELSQLKSLILKLSGQVEENLKSSIQALVERDVDLANRTIAQDHIANRLDVEIDEMAIRLLALRQPAGSDLRLVMTAIKIATDLERMGDLSVNICERAIDLSKEPPLKPLTQIQTMAMAALALIDKAMTSFIAQDIELALEVCRRDEEVDHHFTAIQRELLTYMLEDPRSIRQALALISVAKNLERAADHATNIAELVLYMVKGKVIRHTDPATMAQEVHRIAK
ncbi:MAG: phosphate transport system regulatory protein PhoU [Alphaproteobacteria bacterium CG_4_10_14_0_2_um_filter_63_37]|nr:MAG: phosphate transport system regulatory protein PhoU [Proteobacteria bacterium CG1_02_64_396]PJA23672.1 MAG: phosphate transport system regulatory protein PhoU [Alphaproteobacteria bacterium CG_4_10_14_0_2_um_filter_63_37]